MTEKTAKDFIDALHKLEANRDLDTICGLFSENCEIGNVVTEDKDIGAREFWTSYRGSFDKVKSTFRSEIFADGAASLEWKTTGTNSEGHEFEYEGVSVLEIESDKITRFHAYFDPNKLGKQIVADKTAEG
ncbi:MAG TPA: nuclear transport factor 2 family protein [Pyrinomonadaceae bacterium]|nr:nuclear transport factor 2 family protein [Pyrinomonadaceae bacterium]